MSLSHSPNIVRNGLVLYLDAANLKSYPGSGSTWNDISGNENNGTLINTPTFSSSNAGYFTFNGSNNYINIPTSSNITFNSNDSYSVSSWFYVSSLPGRWSGIVTKSRDLGSWYGLWIDPGNLYTFASTTNNVNLYGSNVTVGWHNVCGVLNKSNNIKILYVDGIQVASTVPTSYYSIGSGDLTIGFAKGTNEYFNGIISNATIYNKALSSTEVSQNFNALKDRYSI